LLNQVLLVAGVLALGFASIRALIGNAEEDPSEVVIDEWAGMWISCLFLPIKPGAMIGAFILFRVFDIWKPLGIRKLEKWKGAAGIMMDDVAAGIGANVLMQIAVRTII